VLILIPADDRLVDNTETRRAQPLISGSTLVEAPGAGHELLREASDIRAQVLARATKFLQQGGMAHPAPRSPYASRPLPQGEREA
jgi:alpha-beta hydrolase superfamily lysophospholipase